MAEILQTVDRYPGTYGVKGLFRQLGYPQKYYTEYRHALHGLMDSGQIVRLGKRRLSPRRKVQITSGILRLTPKGFGFIDRKNDSIFISPREARKAFDGDRIKVEVIDTGHVEGPTGRIISVDDKSRSPMLAQLRRRGGDWFADVKTGNHYFAARVEGSHKGKIRSGNWALVGVEGTRRRYPLPVCHVVQVLGHPDEKGTAEKGLMATYGLKDEYPAEAIKESEKLRVQTVSKRLRRDLTGEFTVTIDPANAKDHDDAVSMRRDEDGNYLLGVHIADVSRYFPEKSAIDKEARNRSFSVYLQHHHLPMLPPKLPGEVCSLKPGRDRLALSVLMHLDRDGRVLKKEIVASKVRIQRLISYETAQDHIDNNDTSDPDLTSQLRQMWRLAKALKSSRLSEGGIEFDLPEADFHWNGGASPERIFREARLESHQLIEEFMLAANRAVAEIWVEKYGAKVPNVFRVHEPPDAEKRQKLSDYLADAGFDWPADSMSTAEHLKALLDEAHRRFPIEVTSIIARKALMLARYDSRSRGHFGLGFKRYLHFTSPIRRYSDLTVHRLIWKYLIQNQLNENRDALKSELEAVINQINERERMIAELERESIKLATLLYLQEHQDQVFDACVVEETNERIYVALEDLFIEGYIAEDYGIQFKSRRHTQRKYQSIRGTGSALSIGDKLQVSISHIDLLSRKLELRPV